MGLSERTDDHPSPGSPEELETFDRLQRQLKVQFEEVFDDDSLPRTVIVVPSLSLDQYVLDKIDGAPFYEERLLCLLMLLRLPRTKVIYLTSNAVSETIVDYYLQMLTGVPSGHARKRLVLMSCCDDSPEPLSQKLLARPRLLARIRAEIEDPAAAHITCFRATEMERSLAVRLGVPLYACDPDISEVGDKSHGREIMREAGVDVPDGAEHLRDAGDMAEALAYLRRNDPDLRRAVVKLNEGFSGEGNSVFEFDGAPDGSDLQNWCRSELGERLAFEAVGETWEGYLAKFTEMGGVVESFIEGSEKRSPNARYRIAPSGLVEPISTQDQILGGPTGQVYLACQFPSDTGYRVQIQEMGTRISEILRDRGVLGQVGHDFLCVRDGGGWKTYGIELNIRMGGATHPFLMLQYLTDGIYDSETASFLTPSGEPRCFIASDNVQSDDYAGLTPDDLIDIAVENDIHFHGASQEGVVFHLIGALSRFGKLGMVAIDETIEGARKRYDETLAIFDRETAR